jgi:hypothetical protein
MFHKYDFGTANQISSLRSRSLDSELVLEQTSMRSPLVISIVAMEVCAILVLCFMPHNMKGSVVGKQIHKASAHPHTFRHMA